MLVNVGVAALAVAGSLVAAELTLRFLYPQPLGVWYPDRDGLTLLQPRLSTYLPQFGVSVNVNSFGLRDREHTLATSDDVFRILILGDSFMEALQIPFEKSFPRLLERELEKNGSGSVEVLNAAVSGWGTDDELTYLQQYGLHLRPDLILVAMTLHNDISDNMKEKFHGWINGRLLERHPTRMSYLQHKVLEMKAFMASRSHLYALLLKFRQAGRNREETNRLQRYVADLFLQTPPGYLRDGWQMTFALLNTIVRAGAEGGARTAVFLIPLSFQLTDQEFSAAVGAEGPTDGIQREKPQQLMRAWGTRESIEVIDLVSEMKDWRKRQTGPLYLSGDGHWNEEGHRLAVAIVARELVRRELVRRVGRTPKD